MRLADKEILFRMPSPTHPRKSPINTVARGTTTTFGAEHAVLRKTVHTALVANETVTKCHIRVAELSVGPARPALAQTWREHASNTTLKVVAITCEAVLRQRRWPHLREQTLERRNIRQAARYLRSPIQYPNISIAELSRHEMRSCQTGAYLGSGRVPRGCFPCHLVGSLVPEYAKSRIPATAGSPRQSVTLHPDDLHVVTIVGPHIFDLQP